MNSVDNPSNGPSFPVVDMVREDVAKLNETTQATISPSEPYELQTVLGPQIDTFQNIHPPFIDEVKSTARDYDSAVATFLDPQKNIDELDLQNTYNTLQLQSHTTTTSKNADDLSINFLDNNLHIADPNTNIFEGAVVDPPEFSRQSSGAASDQDTGIGLTELIRSIPNSPLSEFSNEIQTNKLLASATGSNSTSEHERSTTNDIDSSDICKAISSNVNSEVNNRSPQSITNFTQSVHAPEPPALIQPSEEQAGSRDLLAMLTSPSRSVSSGSLEPIHSSILPDAVSAALASNTQEAPPSQDTSFREPLVTEMSQLEAQLTYASITNMFSPPPEETATPPITSPYAGYDPSMQAIVPQMPYSNNIHSHAYQDYHMNSSYSMYSSNQLPYHPHPSLTHPNYLNNITNVEHAYPPFVNPAQQYISYPYASPLLPYPSQYAQVSPHSLPLYSSNPAPEQYAVLHYPAVSFPPEAAGNNQMTMTFSEQTVGHTPVTMGFDPFGNQLFNQTSTISSQYATSDILNEISTTDVPVSNNYYSDHDMNVLASQNPFATAPLSSGDLLTSIPDSTHTYHQPQNPNTTADLSAFAPPVELAPSMPSLNLFDLPQESLPIAPPSQGAVLEPTDRWNGQQNYEDLFAVDGNSFAPLDQRDGLTDGNTVQEGIFLDEGNSNKDGASGGLGIVNDEAPEKAPQPTEEDNSKQYVVVAGDTLEGVSIKTGVSISNLQRINRIYGKHIYPGQLLSLQVPRRVTSNSPLSAEAAKQPYNSSVSSSLGGADKIQLPNISSSSRNLALGQPIDMKAEPSTKSSKSRSRTSSVTAITNTPQNQPGLMNTIGKGFWGALWGAAQSKPGGLEGRTTSMDRSTTSLPPSGSRRRSNSQVVAEAIFKTTSDLLKRQASQEKERERDPPPYSSTKGTNSANELNDDDYMSRSEGTSTRVHSNSNCGHDEKSSGRIKAKKSYSFRASGGENSKNSNGNGTRSRSQSQAGRGRGRGSFDSADGEVQELLLDTSVRHINLDDMVAPPYGNIATTGAAGDGEAAILHDLEILHDQQQGTGSTEAHVALNTPPKMSGHSHILNAKTSAQIVRKLPQILEFESWVKLYSLLDNGADLTSFFAKTKFHRYSIIVVETTHGDIFGGFADTEWSIAPSFYGGGQSFLFRIDDDLVAAFPWTGLNDLFMWSNLENVAMGGGGGGFGFVLDSDFLSGSTSTCETFANPPLVRSNMGTFNVKNIEVWGFANALTRRRAVLKAHPSQTVLGESFRSSRNK